MTRLIQKRLLISAGVAVVFGCTAQQQPGEQQGGSEYQPVMAPEAERLGARDGASVSTPPPAPAISQVAYTTSASAATNLTQIQNTVDGMIIRTGSARVEVDSLESAIAAVRGLAERVGGYVANVAVQTGEKQLRLATLELKVPAARFDDALGGLDQLGEVESVEVNAQDVGEEYVDVTARVTNARRLEERLIQLLTTRTGKLEEVLAVERELARVREEIERMDGRLRYLRSRVSLSTISVTVHEPAPILMQPGQNVIGQSVLQAWRNFVSFLASMIAALGYLLPLTAIVVALVWIGRRFLRGWWQPRGQTVAEIEPTASAAS